METSIKDLLQKYKSQSAKKQKPPHALSACVDEIEKIVPFTKKYGRGYWLRQLSNYCKRHKLEPASMYTHVLEIVGKAQGLEKKYSKGGFITNKLKA